MKKIVLLLNVIMLLSFANTYADESERYALVTDANGKEHWLKIKLTWNNGYCLFNDVYLQGGNKFADATLNLNEVYTSPNYGGTKETSLNGAGGAALFYSSGITSIYGPIEYVDQCAFVGRNDLKTVNFYKLKNIKEEAFCRCTSLTTVMLPSTIMNIDPTAFRGCTSLTNLTVNESCRYYSCEDLVLYDAHKTGLYIYLDSRKDTLFVVPSTVKVIGKQAFQENEVLKSVIMPNGVETINQSAFYMSKIQSVYIPKSVTTIGYRAFSECKSLTSVKVGNPTPIKLTAAVFPTTTTLYVPQGSKAAYESANYWKDVAAIEEYEPAQIIQFADAATKSVCVRNWDYDGDGELSIEEAQAVTEIDTQFKDNTQMTSFNELQYFTHLQTIKANAFSGCTNLASFTVPASLTVIGQNAFDNTAWLASQPNGVVYIGHLLYIYKGTMPENTKIVVREGTTTVCEAAFYNKAGLVAIELPGSLNTIGNYAFSICTGLTSVTIPEGVTEIPLSAFSNNTSLKSVELPENLVAIGESAFQYCPSLDSIVIPDKVRTIGNSAFSNCLQLKSVYMPKWLMRVGRNAFKKCEALERVDITNLGGWCNVDFEDSKSNPLLFAHHLYINGKELTDLEVPTYSLTPYYNYKGEWVLSSPDLEKIKDYAFYGCEGLKTVVFSNYVTSVGNCAFAGCTALKSVKTPETKPFDLHKYAFTSRENTSLYVSNRYLYEYQNAEYWKDFKQVKAYPDADVNEDAEIDIVDVVDIINYSTKGDASDTFVRFLADMNSDGTINAKDAELVEKQASKTSAVNELPVSENVNAAVSAGNIQIRTDESNAASICLQNGMNNLVGFQMDVVLPEGISLVEDGCMPGNRFADADQQLLIGKLGNNTYRLSSTSLSLQPITGNEGEIVRIELSAGELTDNGSVVIKNIRLVTDNSERLVLENTGFDIQIIDATPALAFKDEAVKSICVTQWDVNGDGELSTREAAKVTDIGTTFQGNTVITAFKELQYFTGLTAIAGEAFKGCSNLASVSIPENVKEIGDQAFGACYYLKTVYSCMTTPPAITSTTFANYAATLYVPRNCKTVYENASVWNSFAQIVVMLFREGDGTEDNPYLLFDAKDFANLASDVSYETLYRDTYFKVAKAEIDFSGVSYLPIGREGRPFGGHFDGNGVTIKNLSTNKAVFGYTGFSGTVANITVDESCKVNATIYDAAGIVAANCGVIDNCVNKAPIFSSRHHVGGICGDNMGTISNCRNYGAVTCTDEQSSGMFGGIAGDIDGGKILNCENYGAVYCKSAWVGGIAGLVVEKLSTIENCANYGDVTGTYQVGGIFGYVVTIKSMNYVNHVVRNNIVSACTITGLNDEANGGSGSGAAAIGTYTTTAFMNNFYTQDVVVKIGTDTYVGQTPRGAYTDRGLKDVTENCAATMLITGDVTGDGKVDISDYIGVANHILGIPQEGFIEKAADVNEDGVIDVSDYLGVGNIIHTGSVY